MEFSVRWSKAKKFVDDNFDTGVDGVYLIGYRDTSSDERFVVYVGQGDVDKRLADHLDNNRCVARKIGQAGRVGYYRYAGVGNEDDRLDIELGLYRNHGGKAKLCNEVEPPGSGRYNDVSITETFP